MNNAGYRQPGPAMARGRGINPHANQGAGSGAYGYNTGVGSADYNAGQGHQHQSRRRDGSGSRERHQGGRQHSAERNQNWRDQTRQGPGGNGQQGQYDQYGQAYHGQYGNAYGQERRGKDDTFLSKTLASILRHNAERFGFTLMKGGFLYVEDILHKTHKLHGYTLEDVQRVVANNDKKRFTMEKDMDGYWKIRANQGHSLEVEDLELTPITNADDFPQVIHGTYHTSWELIKKTGLRNMKRNHIHFAAGMPGQNEVISGMRSSCEVVIYIDLKKALNDGLKFYCSANNVILSPGNEDGFIYPCYFEGVLDRKQRHKLEFDNTICSSPAKGHTAGQKDGKRKIDDGKSKKQAKQERKNSQSSSDTHQTSEPQASTSEPRQSGMSSGKRDTDTKGPSSRQADTKSPSREKGDRSKSGEHSDKSKSGEQRDAKRKADDDQGSRQEPQAVEDAKESCKDWNTPVLIKEADISVTVVEDLLKAAENKHLAVVCCGEKLGQQDSSVNMMVILVNPQIYVYHLHGNKTIVKEGHLLSLLASKSINKVFHNIGEISPSLIQEFDILLDGTPIWDIELVQSKITIPSMDMESLNEDFNFTPAVFKKWAIENETFGKQAACEELDIGSAMVQELVKRGKLMYQLYDICSSRLTGDISRKLKKEIFKIALPTADKVELFTKFEKLKMERKETEKLNKKETNQSQKSQPDNQSQGGKSSASGKQGQKSGGKKKKK